VQFADLRLEVRPNGEARENLVELRVGSTSPTLKGFKCLGLGFQMFLEPEPVDWIAAVTAVLMPS